MFKKRKNRDFVSHSTLFCRYYINKTLNGKENAFKSQSKQEIVR